MTLPTPAPRLLQARWQSLGKADRRKLVELVLGKNAEGGWAQPADRVAFILGLDGASIAQSTIRDYRRAVTMREQMTK